MNSPFLDELKSGIVQLFYPRLCEGCSRQLLQGEEVLCIGCSAHMPETGYHTIADNETALRFAGRVPFVRATTLAYFTNEGLLQHLLHGLKYGGKKDIGYYLGGLLGQRLKEAGWAQDIDLIIPVPLHKAKQRSRGYNQSLLIAEGMSRRLGIPCTDTVLLRSRETESQTKKTRTERVNNMTNAFSVKENAGLDGKHVLLCDDVLTTGATIEACAAALQAVKNIKISIVTIGIAVS